jgi:DNA-binding beta-propeller fold protein YncE
MGGAVQGTTPLALLNISSTYAGTPGSAGFNNYSAPLSVTPATFNHPTDVTTDGTNFYIADNGNNLIRQITPSKVVRTLQCTDINTGLAIGFNRPSSITTDGTNLYVTDTGSNTIRIIDIRSNKVTIIGSTEGLAGSVDSATDKTAVRFNQPIGITTDGENLYVTDSGNHTVRRIVILTGAVSTLAGTSGAIGSDGGIQGAARFNQPARITTDRSSLYLADLGSRTIRKIDILTGLVTTFAGSAGPLGVDVNGFGTAARFNQPNGITTDGVNLYVTDSFQNKIRMIRISTQEVTTLAITGPPGLHAPAGITTNGISLFVADTYILNSDNTSTLSNTIQKIE